MEEVYITEDKDQTRWQPRKPDPDLEAEMLRRLMVRFGVQEARAKQQIAAAAEAPRASLASAKRRRHIDASTSSSTALAPRRAGARSCGLYRRGPRPLQGPLFRALYRSGNRREDQAKKSRAFLGSMLGATEILG